MLHTIKHLTPLGNHPFERTYKVHTPQLGAVSLKVFRAPEAWTKAPDKIAASLTARIPHIEGIPPWLGFGTVDERTQNEMNLEHGQWFYGARPWIEGKPLASHDGLTSQWRTLALSIAQRLRDLHEIGYVHADLQPHNVILDTAQRTWLIDLPLLTTSPHERGHVAGSAPMMAPELWRGATPNVATDMYALACLTTWMGLGGRPSLNAQTLSQWAKAHELGQHQLPEQFGGRLKGIIERMLSPNPTQRPELQEFIDELATAEHTAPPSALLYRDDPHAEVLRNLLSTLAQSKSHPTNTQMICIDAPKQGGKSHLVHQLSGRLELLGRTVVHIEGQTPRPRANASVKVTQGPWASVLYMIDVLRHVRGLEVDSSWQFPQGDQIYTFDWLLKKLEEALPPQGAVIIWDDYDQCAPDIRAWWQHSISRLPRNSGLQLVSTLSESIHDLPAALHHTLRQPSTRQWHKWRATTSRAEVRDIAQGQWEQLVQDHGQHIGGMLDALHQHLGWSQHTEHITPTGQDWRGALEQMKEAMHYRAYRQVIKLASHMANHAKSPGPTDALALWTDALLAVGAKAADASLLDQALSADPTDHALFLRLKLAHGLGEHSKGLSLIEAHLAHQQDEIRRASLLRWKAQMELSSGQFQHAQHTAESALDEFHAAEHWTDALAQGIRTEDLAHLSVLAQAARAIGGNPDGIAALKALAPRLETQDVPPSLRGKCHAYMAIGLARQNKREAATDAYLRALEEIEEAGLASELPLYLLNVGTAYHQQGRLGLAREYYARGTRVAQPTTRATTRAWLLCNQANIDMVLGRLNEAQSLIERARDIATEHSLHAIDATAQAFEGYILASKGATQHALATYQRCLERNEGLSTQLRAELQLHSVEVLIQEDRADEAQQLINDARQLIDKHQIAPLQDYHGILRARLQWIDGSATGLMGGIELFRRRLLSAMDTGNYKLILQQSPYLLEQLKQEGLLALGEEIISLVTRAKNAIAMGLTRELREDFFSNLPNFDAKAPQITTRTAPQTHPTNNMDDSVIERFYRMLSLNEIILHTEHLDQLWPKALKIALSLSGAERGFLLLRQTDERTPFKIAASSDVDGDTIAQPHLNVSLTIAQEAAQTGRTVLTLNAREDERFNVALSVVDLDLTSVLCVPVRNAQGLLGALYLDHRFQPGIFQGQVPRMMEAFGHQLALAITNIRRREALEQEQLKLKRAHKELNALLAEREAHMAGLQQRLTQLSEEVVRQRSQGDLHASFPKIAFTSRVMERVLMQVERIASSDISAVIIGESGTGKELIAQAIHQASPRANGPFVAFNCGAVTETLFESEMFGHLKGAFTGATMDRQGLFQAAQGGTIFLDELGEMPLSMQVKLLRVLQERKVRRLGATQHETIDVRIVAATNKNLTQMIEDGTFREDLYYRLAAFNIHLPPLRDRREDIALIAHTLIERLSEKIVHRPLRLTPEAALLLSECPWPGNIRELENTLRAACVLCDGDEITPQTLATLLSRTTPQTTSSTATSPSRPIKSSRRGRKPKASRHDVVSALDAHPEDIEAAAQHLGVSVRTLYRYMQRFGLN